MSLIAFVITLLLVVLAVTFWYTEIRYFIDHVRLMRSGAGNPVRNFFWNIWVMVTGLPKAIPFIVDIGFTMFVLSAFGLSTGLYGPVIALTMSTTAGFFITRELRKWQQVAPA